MHSTFAIVCLAMAISTALAYPPYGGYGGGYGYDPYYGGGGKAENSLLHFSHFSMTAKV